MFAYSFQAFGIFSFIVKIIKAVVDVVLQALAAVVKLVFSFLKPLLESPLWSILSEAFQEYILNPIISVLMDVVGPMLEILFGLLRTALDSLLFILFTQISKLINFFSDAFYVMSGVDPVYKINGLNPRTGFVSFADTQFKLLADGSGMGTTSLTNSLFGTSLVTDTLMGLTLIGVLAALFFTILVMAKSAGELGQKTPSQVLKLLARTMLTFLLVPVICMASINMVQILLIKTQEVITGSAGASGRLKLGDTLYLSVLSEYLPESTMETVRKGLLEGGFEGWMAGNYITFMAGTIKTGAVDYFVAVLSGLLVLVLLMTATIQAVVRLFQLIFLYLVSPIFVAVIPLDGGKCFDNWREMFLSRLVGTYVTVISFQLYLMAVPIIISMDLDMGTSIGNIAVRTLFVAGAGFSVTHSARMVSKLIGAGEETLSMSYMMARNALTKKKTEKTDKK